MTIRFAHALFAMSALAGCGLIRIGQDACDHTPGLCGPGGSGGVMLSCTLAGTFAWECNVVPPGPNAAWPQPISHKHPGVCGSVYCAGSEEEARGKSGAASNPLLSCVPFDGVPPPTWGGCIPPQDTDGGPCRLLGEACSHLGKYGSPDCCPYQQIVSGGPASNLGCEPTDLSVNDQVGICQAMLWQPCNTAADCYQSNTADDKPADCQDVCCFGEGRGCFNSIDYTPQEQGCCHGLACKTDAIGNGWWCQ